MFICQYCMQELESRGERFRLYDVAYDVECEWCGEIDDCIDIRFNVDLKTPSTDSL